jgi:multiple sugar transport system permease protein/sn-glycerol 3-phosphate transport system permease protein
MQIDGAGDLRIFRHLIWPLLTPTTFFVLISTVIFSLQQVFTPIDLLTEGGPSNSTTNLFYMVYQYAFKSFNLGYGSAATVLLFVLLVAVTFLKIRGLERSIHYQ